MAFLGYHGYPLAGNNHIPLGLRGGFGLRVVLIVPLHRQMNPLAS